MKELPLRLERAHRRVAAPRRISPPRNLIAAQARAHFRGRESGESFTRGNPLCIRDDLGVSWRIRRRRFGRHDDPELARLRRHVLPGLGRAAVHDAVARQPRQPAAVEMSDHGDPRARMRFVPPRRRPNPLEETLNVRGRHRIASSHPVGDDLPVHVRTDRETSIPEPDHRLPRLRDEDQIIIQRHEKI